MSVGVARPKDRSDRTIAVIGASADRAKFGNKSVRAHVEAGYTVWPVNPHADVIEGLPVYRSLYELPSLPHRATIYLREEPALEVLEQLARMEEKAGDEITAVYLNPGADSPAVVERAETLGLKHVEQCSIRAIGRTPDEFPDE